MSQNAVDDKSPKPGPSDRPGGKEGETMGNEDKEWIIDLFLNESK